MWIYYTIGFEARKSGPCQLVGYLDNFLKVWYLAIQCHGVRWCCP